MDNTQNTTYKYDGAVQMYATTDFTVRKIAGLCGLTPSELSHHIAKHHRALMFARYGLDAAGFDLRTVKVKPSKGQSLQTHIKYKDAIAACSSAEYIEYNISQIARMFGLNGTALASQLRVHFPNVIPDRESIRQRLGLSDNAHRGPRRYCAEAYGEALVMYRSTDLTISEVAEKCNVSKSGLSQFLRFYHKDIIEQKSARRKASQKKVGVRRPGNLSGNGQLYGPKPATVARYAQALELYRCTSLTIDEIVKRAEVSESGFRGYLQQWHRGEKLRRRGYVWDGESEPDLNGTRQFLKSTATKYAPAIASLKENPHHVAEVAEEFGLNPEVFRAYLKMHEPELAKRQGMTLLSNGRMVKRLASEKYAKAINEYATTAEPLKSIAHRHGIVYNSLSGYVMRNCKEERESHRKNVEASVAKK